MVPVIGKNANVNTCISDIRGTLTERQTTDSENARQTGRWTERQMSDGHRDIQTHRQNDKQPDRETETERQTETLECNSVVL